MIKPTSCRPKWTNRHPKSTKRPSTLTNRHIKCTNCSFTLISNRIKSINRHIKWTSCRIKRTSCRAKSMNCHTISTSWGIKSPNHPNLPKKRVSPFRETLFYVVTIELLYSTGSISIIRKFFGIF